MQELILEKAQILRPQTVDLQAKLSPSFSVPFLSVWTYGSCRPRYFLVESSDRVCYS